MHNPNWPLFWPPSTAKRSEPSEQKSFGDFVGQVYLPFYRRKWKRSTAMTNEDRLAHHLTSEFDPRSLGSFDRDELQAFLDRKGTTLSFSVVDHLRWDLKQIFDMAVAEGYLQRCPAALLFTPRECRRAATRVMTVEEVRQLFSVLDVRELLIAKLALLAGMRPGEIFGLKWARMEAEYADIRQRIYRAISTHQSRFDPYDTPLFQIGCSSPSTTGGLYRSTPVPMRGCSHRSGLRRRWQRTTAGDGVSCQNSS
jgi:integrase